MPLSLVPFQPRLALAASHMPSVSAWGMSCLQIPVKPWQAHGRCDQQGLNASPLLPHILALQLCSIAKGRAHSFPYHLSAPHYTSSCLSHAKKTACRWGPPLSCYFWPFLGKLLFTPVWNLRWTWAYWCSKPQPMLANSAWESQEDYWS